MGCGKDCLLAMLATPSKAEFTVTKVESSIGFSLYYMHKKPYVRVVEALLELDIAVIVNIFSSRRRNCSTHLIRFHAFRAFGRDGGGYIKVGLTGRYRTIRIGSSNDCLRIKLGIRP